MDGLVSVIIPTYNRERVVGECLDSVCAQKYVNLEIIIIDDGSSDDTKRICRAYAAKDGRIRVVEAAHGGVSAARNKGLESANGEYVFFLDSDDVIHPGLLGALVKGMSETGAALGGSGIWSVAEKNWKTVGRKIAEDRGDGETVLQKHKDALELFFTTTTPINLIGGVIMRRDWIGDTRFREDVYIGEDYYFVYENLVKGANVVFLKQKWYFARIHEGNSSWDYSFAGFWTRFFRRELVWKQEELYGRQENVNRQKRDAVGVYNRCAAKNDYRSDDSKKMRQTMKRYRKEILPALSLKSKVVFLLSVYTPAVFSRVEPLLRRIRKKIRK